MFATPTYVKGRVGDRVVSRPVVVATGITATGDREVLGIDLRDSEDGALWTAFVNGLPARRLTGLQLVFSDHHLELKAAIPIPGRPLQPLTMEQCQGLDRRIRGEVCEGAVQIVLEHRHEHGSQWEAICSVAEKLSPTARRCASVYAHEHRTDRLERKCEAPRVQLEDLGAEDARLATGPAADRDRCRRRASLVTTRAARGRRADACGIANMTFAGRTWPHRSAPGARAPRATASRFRDGPRLSADARSRPRPRRAPKRFLSAAKSARPLGSRAASRHRRALQRAARPTRPKGRRR